jgi:putative peptidoglycan lipid II flippase
LIDALRMHLGFQNIWQQHSVNRRIFATILTVGGLSFVVNLAATAKELVVAKQFGTGDVLDAFLIAFLLPSFAINVVAGSFSAALIPTFIQVRENEGLEKAQQLFSSVTLWNSALLVIVSILLAMTSSFILPILGSGFSAEKLALTHSIFFILLPILAISGLGITCTAILNAGEHFALAAISPMIKPIITVALLVVMSKIWGIYALAAGTVCGVVLEAGLLAWGVRRRGFYLAPRWHGLTSPMKKVINQYIPIVAGALLMCGSMLVDQAMAAMLGPGSVATLNYGGKVVTLIIGIGSVSLSTAVFPHFSRMVAVYDWVGIRHTLKTYTYLILLVTIPLTLCLVYFSEPIVRLFFERGAFTSVDTWRVSQVQVLFLLQVPFYFLGILMVRLISSLKANRILMQAAILNLFSKIIFNYLLMQRLGVAGIALSTTLVYMVSLIYCSIMLYKQIKPLE